MKFRLDLLSGVHVHGLETGAEIPLRTYRGILAALGFAPKPLTREDLIELVWPDVSLSVGRNRLRVALARFRAVLPNAILESEQGLHLNPDVIESEANRLREGLDHAHDSVTNDSERQSLRTVLSEIRSPAEFNRSQPAATEFGVVLAGAFLRLAELETLRGDHDSALDASVAATYFHPESLEAWEAFLLAHWRRGTPNEAADEARNRAPDSVQTDKQFRDTLSKVQAKTPGVVDRSAMDRKDFLAELINSVANSRPEIMRSILAAPEALALAGKHPRLMHDFLEQSTPLDPPEKDATWERAAARMIGLKAWLGDAEGVIESSAALLKASQDPAILRAIWNSVAVAHSLARRWDQAFDALDKTMEYSRVIGSEMYELSTLGNGAYFTMQQGRYDEADAEYESLVRRCELIGTPQANFEKAIALGNRALIPVFQGDWDNAMILLEKAIQVRSQSGLELQMGIPQAALALSRARSGISERTVPLMRSAFLDAIHSDSIRSQQFTFEIAAVLVAGLGDKAFANGLLRWVEEWRHRSGAPRSQAESDLAAYVPPAPDPVEVKGEPAAVGKDVMKRIRLLTARK